MIKPIRPNAVIVLEALIAGIPVKIGVDTFELIPDPRWGKSILAVPSFDEQGNQLEYYLPTDVSLQNFLILCDNMTDYERDVIACNLGLNYAN